MSKQQQDPEQMVEALTGANSIDREEMVADYLPDEYDFDAKTQLDMGDPHRLALLRNYNEIMPELEHMQGTLDSFADDFTKAQTSVAGDSRNDFRKILMAMFGASEDRSSPMSAFAKALGADGDEDD